MLSLCQLSRDYARYRDQVIIVRGAYYYGLREECSANCVAGPWPSLLHVTASRASDPSLFALDKVVKDVVAAAKKGGRFEVRVTVVGKLLTQAKPSPLGPCDRIGSGLQGYGHLGGFPAELVVQEFRDVEVKVNPRSPYDYSNIYRGAL